MCVPRLLDGPIPLVNFMHEPEDAKCKRGADNAALSPDSIQEELDSSSSRSCVCAGLMNNLYKLFN